MISVTDKDIAYAESVLLREGQHFDDERVCFIKNLNTIDLQAVPGSGKTTALLAKLLILEKYMPLKDGRGVLVISHTNAAVDEIKERIGKFCPKLFTYPNFVGTIQSFVDVFLAIPFYANQFKQKPIRIDNEIYDEQVLKFYANTPNLSLKGYLDKQNDGLGFLKSIRINTQWKLIRYLSGTPESFKLKYHTKPIYKSLLKFKLDMLKKGYLHFDDAYTLANFQLDKVSNYPSLLQKRFMYVFVDEMQDMDTHQHDLLEALFHDNGESESNFQRIGDKNQAIFNGGSIHVDNIWSERENILYLNGSHRLNQNIASQVEKLALTSNPVEGRNENSDGTSINIKPVILLYQNDSKTRVISAFAKKIQTLQDRDLIPIDPSHKFMAIGWRKEVEGDEKMGLSDYLVNFSSSGQKNKIDYKVLADYVAFYDKDKKTLESVRKNILNGLLKILRIENIYDEYGRAYIKRTLINLIKGLDGDQYEVLKLNIYKWSIDSIKGELEKTLNSIQEYIPEFLLLFGETIDKSSEFINGNSEVDLSDIEPKKPLNMVQLDDIKVEVGTIHSVKGQTHTATLYLETYFQKDGNGVNAKSYESQRLAAQISGSPLTENVGTRVKQSAKMAYVGFSRPTHLLCLAIHKDRFDHSLSSIGRDIWEIIEVVND